MRLASQKGTASVKNVAINLAKTAAGTGILALPFACQQGGLLLFVFGTVAIAVWNVFALKRLCDCLELLIDVENSPASKIFARPLHHQIAQYPRAPILKASCLWRQKLNEDGILSVSGYS